MKTQTDPRKLFSGLMLALCVLVTSVHLGCAPTFPAGGVAMAHVLRSDKRRQEPGSFDQVRMPELVAANAAFAVDLYQALLDTERNLVFSPHSLSLALAMTYAGARGETEREMAEVLHLAGLDRVHPGFNALDQALGNRAEHPGVEIAFANALWPREGVALLDSFLDLLAEHYGAGLQPLDFGQSEVARRQINAWVSDETEERVQELLPEGAVDGETALVLTNAVYLYASWLHAFPEQDTHASPFHRLGGDSVDAQMMSLSATLNYARLPGAEAVELPYAGEALTMVVLVPEAGSFESFARGLSADGLASLLGSMQAASLRLELPRFSYDSGFELKEALAYLGMAEAFGPTADFSGMDGTQELYLDNVYHKAFVSVDETGTEAAAASAVVMSRKGPGPAQELVVDRPFIYLVRDVKSGAILFLGHVMDPVA